MIDFFLNPNVAYLFLVGGFSLALLAILAPGTGILEIVAILALLLAGWGVYNLPIQYWALVVLILGMLFFVLAIRKTGNWKFLAISILALVVGSVYLFDGNQWWQPAVHPVLALVVSVMVGSFFWIVATKTLEARSAPMAHDLAPLVGMIGEAKSEIHHEGSVQVHRELWSAHSATPIPIGATVRILERDGFVLEVEEVN